MDWKKLQPSAAALWALVEEQHGVVTRRQLLEHGLSSRAVEHRIAVGRLHRISHGVYAVGRPTLTARGRWMAAVLGCGPQAALSHSSAAALWGLARSRNADGIEVSVPAAVCRRRRGVILHRRQAFGPADVTRREGIPVTSPLCTLIDLAARLDPRRLEAAINEADKLDLIDPDTLRAALDGDGRCPGTSALRASLDRATFVLTDSELERRFLPWRAGRGCPSRRPAASSTASRLTSTGPASAWWSRPTGFVTTALLDNRRATACATSSILPPA